MLLVPDNLDVHHCKAVKVWLAGHNKHIQVFLLPSYSPEINPDDRLNAEHKQAISTKVPVRAKAKLHVVDSQHMQFTQSNPWRIRVYFQPRSASTRREVLFMPDQ